VNVALCPGVNVTGGMIPEMLNPVPDSATAEIVALVPPVLVRVSVWLEVWPTVMFVYVKLVGAGVNTAAPTDVPVSGIDKLGFDAFDVTVAVPGNVPAEVGAKVTVNVVLCPAVNVTGGVIPEMLNPVPDAATAEIVALAPPVLVSVSVWLEVCPTVMFVYVKLVGDTVKVAWVTAVPLKGIDKLRFDAFDVTVAVPGNVPAEVGAKVTVNVVLCPAVNVTGGVIPEILNPVPDAATAEMVALVPPVFLIVSVWLEVCPTVIFV
jgi:hypothetical protein